VRNDKQPESSKAQHCVDWTPTLLTCMMPWWLYTF